MIPIMPREFEGKVGKGCGYTASLPRRWTEDEISWVVKLKKLGFSNEQIAISTGRTAISIQIKLKRLGKSGGTYNKGHVADKYACNAQYLSVMQPKSVLDIYCGERSWWSSQMGGVETNDINASFNADHHERAEMLIHKLYYEGKTYDVIDLDPFGSAYECFDLAVKMATKGIVVTFGELGHKRWKRLDYVRRYYGIDNMRDFTLDGLMQHLQTIAERNKKQLIPIIVRNWGNIGRVWYRIEKLKISEQWEHKKPVQLDLFRNE